MPRLHSSTILCLCLCLCLGSAGAFAQPASAQGVERDGEREHRRAELRTALQVKRSPPVSEASAHEAPARQLSPSERAEMRQQLRQQQAQSQRYPP
jgi:hypothetical protein